MKHFSTVRSVCTIITDNKQTKTVQDNNGCLVTCGRIYFWQLCFSQNSQIHKIIYSKGSNNPISVTIMLNLSVSEIFELLDHSSVSEIHMILHLECINFSSTEKNHALRRALYVGNIL